MAADQKTKALQRIDISMSKLDANEKNPNKMSKREFDLLIDNLEKTGMTDPILVRKMPAGRYRIIGGHHRYKGAEYLGWDEVPCTVITDPDFDDDQEKFQIVRMNMIRGRMDPSAFADLMNSLGKKYNEEILADAFGFADEAEFNKMVNHTAKALPNAAMKAKFKEAAKEIRTVDGLAKLLNTIFTKYGDTMPYGFMVFDHAGQNSIWIQMSAKTRAAFNFLGDFCIENNRTIDDLLGGILQEIDKGKMEDLLDRLCATTPEVVIPEGFKEKPTKQNLKALENTVA